MTAETAFQLLNLAVLPWWATWLVAPRSRIAALAASHGAVFVALALVYTSLFVAIVAGGGGGGFGFDAMRARFARPDLFLAGWTHYLCLDLFVGAWILRESRRIDVEPRPFLFFTLVAGPLGLGSFLLRRWWKLRSLGQIGEVDLV